MSEAKEASEAKPKSKKGLVLIVAGVVLVAAGGGGFYWWKNQQAAAAASEEEHGKKGKDKAHAEAEEEGHPEASGVLSFEPFIVNLADGPQRYLKATVQVLVNTEEDVKELQENAVVTSRMRSAILESLSQQTSEHIVTPEGKEKLKHELVEKCGEILEEGEVVDVLFTEFVVQF
ncbi:MAG: flagellar basal body-associated protein FliL [Vicinamibacterales bacterium]